MILNNYPKISVITPSYNQGQFIEETIQSVLNQNYPNLEFIIIDGGSSDNSVEVIKKYENFLTYWHSKLDKGQSNAINIGFKIASGELLCWLNSDDTFLPGALLHVGELYKKNMFDFYYSDVFLTNEKNEIIKRIKARKTSFEAECYGYFAIPQQGSFWTRDTLIKAGSLNEDNKTCMDGEFFINILKIHGINIIVDSFPTAKFRIHPDSLTGSQSNKKQYKLDRELLLNNHIGKSSLIKYLYYNYISRIFSIFYK